MATKNKNALIWGIILVTVGTLIIFSNFDIDIWAFIARMWPVILIVWGVWKLYYGLKEKQEEEIKTEITETTQE